jgi:hypothetical protein
LIKILFFSNNRINKKYKIIMDYRNKFTGVLTLDNNGRDGAHGISGISGSNGSYGGGHGSNGLAGSHGQNGSPAVPINLTLTCDNEKG